MTGGPSTRSRACADRCATWSGPPRAGPASCAATSPPVRSPDRTPSRGTPRRSTTWKPSCPARNRLETGEKTRAELEGYQRGVTYIQALADAGEDMAHLNLVRIHPWKDGNGRMSRALSTLVFLPRGPDAARVLLHRGVARPGTEHVRVVPDLGGRGRPALESGAGHPALDPVLPDRTPPPGPPGPAGPASLRCDVAGLDPSGRRRRRSRAGRAGRLSPAARVLAREGPPHRLPTGRRPQRSASHPRHPGTPRPRLARSPRQGPSPLLRPRSPHGPGTGRDPPVHGAVHGSLPTYSMTLRAAGSTESYYAAAASSAVPWSGHDAAGVSGVEHGHSTTCAGGTPLFGQLVRQVCRRS